MVGRAVNVTLKIVDSQKAVSAWPTVQPNKVMAEFVEYRTEKWVSGLEQLEKIQLFTPNEIKEIKKRKRDFEYKFARKTKRKEDILKHIQYEMDLHRTIKARKVKMGIKPKMSAIEDADARRIAGLFAQRITRCQDDVKLWFTYFKFCQGVGLNELVTEKLVKMVQVHSDKIESWIFASKWELEQNKSVENARQFLLKGLRFHPESKELYTELFKLELEFVQLKVKEKEEKSKARNWAPSEVTEQVIKYVLVETTYESAIKKINDVEFKISLLSLAKTYPNSENLQNKIIKDLVQNHSNNELTWTVLAQRELEGLVYKDEEVEMEVERESPPSTLRERIQRSVNVYEEAVKKLNNVKIWSLYLDHLIELNNDLSILGVFKGELLQSGMRGALDRGHIEEKHCLYWIDKLWAFDGKKKKSAKVKLEDILRRVTELHPKSVKLWHKRLRFYLSLDKEEAGAEVFKEATKMSGNDLSLWKLMMQYLQTKSPAKVEKMFSDGLALGGEISQGLKPFYIEWLVLTKGIGHARRIFETPELLLPPCLELIKKMASLESVQPDTNMKAIRRCHELSCSHFGSNNIDVWLEYVRFERKFGEPPKVSLVYQRAMKELDKVHADQFAAKFNAFKTSA